MGYYISPNSPQISKQVGVGYLAVRKMSEIEALHMLLIFTMKDSLMPNVWKLEKWNKKESSVLKRQLAESGNFQKCPVMLCGDTE